MANIRNIKATAKRSEAHNAGTVGVEDEKPLVKPGEYEVMFLSHSTWLMFGRRAKICLKFQVVTPGAAFGKVLEKHYNVKKLKAPMGRNGSFVVAWSGKFLRDFTRLLGAVSRGRTDRMPMTRFENNIFKVKVETVKIGMDQTEIPPEVQYSVIRDLIEVVEGRNANAASRASELLPIPAPIPIPTKNGGSQ